MSEVRETKKTKLIAFRVTDEEYAHIERIDEALTIMTLMGHKDLKTTMRYIKAVRLQREVRPEQVVH